MAAYRGAFRKSCCSMCILGRLSGRGGTWHTTHNTHHWYFTFGCPIDVCWLPKNNPTLYADPLPESTIVRETRGVPTSLQGNRRAGLDSGAKWRGSDEAIRRKSKLTYRGKRNGCTCIVVRYTCCLPNSWEGGYCRIVAC